MESKNLIFKILGDHRDILNPYDEIRELNKSVFIDEKSKLDYLATQLDTDIGLAELWGERDKQEDRVAVGQVPEFLELSEEERLFALKKTVETLQQTLKEKHLGSHEGSTLCAVVVAPKTVYTVNIGDSMAFLIRISKDGESAINRLNQNLHSPENVKEQQRLKTAGKTSIQGRLGGGLAVSRALGDEDYVKEGLSHEPEIDLQPFIMSPDETVFVVVACDGLTEGGSMTEAMIAEMVVLHREKPSDEIAEKLAQKAKQLGSQDNISVIVMPIIPQKNLVPFAAVFDGHGGDAVSDMLASEFEGTLKFVMNFILIMKTNSE